MKLVSERIVKIHQRLIGATERTKHQLHQCHEKTNKQKKTTSRILTKEK